MERKLQVAATLQGVSTLSDGGMSVRFHTQELPQEDALILMGFRNAFGWLLFRENEFSDKDLPKESAEYEGKTPSQRLRSVLYVLWQQTGSEGDFEVFYRDRVNKIVEQIKQKLE